jgi:succinate dehydrogenase/fumarate reductase flavoprotein subunit
VRNVAELESLGKVIETDVLVIGGGIAGLWAANRAREFVDRVMVVDKGPRDWGGIGSASGGGFLTVLPGENVDDFLQDLVYYYDGLCQQELFETILGQSYDRIRDYQRLGVEFFTEPDGSLRAIPQRGLEHITCCLAKPFGRGGKSMVATQLKEADRLGVKRLGRILVTDLIKDNGKVAGAIGFNTINGDFYIYKANAIILATGHGAWKTQYFHNTCTGEGTAMALRAGAEVSNFEFARVWNVPRWFAWEGQTYLLPLGARFINAKGEPFMERYSPVLGANTDPHYVVRAMAFEAREGRGPFYLDCSQMKQEDKELMKPTAGWMELNYQKLLKMGMNFFEDKLEWMPQLSYIVGGVNADAKGRTSVPGLFVAGRARAIDPSVYSGGLSLCLAAVTGRITGESAGRYAASQKHLQIDSGEVKALKCRLFALLGKEGIPPKEVTREIQETIFPADVCILKNDASLKKTLARTESIRDDLLPRMGARDAHDLMKSIEVCGMTLLTELFLRASLMRTESRAGHYREDYPNYDDKNWLRWIIISYKGEKLSLHTEPVPFDKYKFKPTRYYSDNFKFSK